MPKFVFLRKVLTVLAFMALPVICFGQIDPGCDPDDPTCPIDGGIGLLIAAGIGLGAKRSLNGHKNKKN